MAIPGLTSPIPGLLTARYAGGSIVLGGIDLLGSLQSQSVLAFAYSDNTSDKADDLAVEISDPGLTWMTTFLPQKGIECEVIIKVFNWNAPGDTREFNCGAMWIDEINLIGPPNIVSIRATSIPVTTGLKTEKQYHFWEGQDLQAIASEIATQFGLALVWDTTNNPKLKRTDVVETAYLEYIRDRAKDEGLSIKIFNKQLVIYSEEEYEARVPVYVLTYGLSQILSYAFTDRLNDTYASARNAYVSPESGDLIEGEFVPEEPPTGSGSILQMNQRVEEEEEEGGGDGPELRKPKAIGDTIDYSNENATAAAAASRKAKSQLREKNKREKEAVIVVVGNPGYISGLNVQLIGFGSQLDGKWFISSSIHSISENGYATELRMRKALKGY
jgi:hypothetical protein